MDAETQLRALGELLTHLQGEWPESPVAQLDYASRIGPVVGSLREQCGWSQHMLARRADVDMGLVVRLERGSRLPSLTRLERISDALVAGCDPGT